MSDVPNTHIDSLGYDLEDWLRLSDEEQQEVINDQIADMSDEEIEEFRSDLRSEFSDACERYEEALDDLEDGLDRIRDEEAQRRGERLVEELEEMIDECDDALDEIRDFIDDYTDRNIDGTDGDNVIFNAATAGEGTYTISTGGNPAGYNPFDPTADVDLSDPEAVNQLLIDEGYLTEEGELVGGEGRTAADIETFLAEQERLQAEQQQTITINVGGDQQVDLIGYDEATGTTTFRITDSDGTYRDVIIEGRPRLVFTGGITQESVASWGDPLLKRTHFGNGNTQSLHRLLNEDEYEFDTSNYDSEGHDDMVSDINATSTLEHTGGTLNANEVRVLEEIFDILDELRVNGTLEPDDIRAAWDEIIQLINSNRVRAGARDGLVAQLTFICFKNMSLTDFTKFFNPAVTRLEDIILVGGVNARDIAIMGILENFAGAGHYGGTAFFNQAFQTEANPDGPYSGDKAINALERYNRMASAAGQTPGPEVDLLELEEEIEDANHFADVHGGMTQEELQDAVDDIMRELRANPDVVGDDGDLGDEGDWVDTEVLNFLNNVIMSDGFDTIEELASHILTYVAGRDGNDIDEFASVVIWILHRHAPQLLQALFRVSGWGETMYNDYIENGSSIPALQDEVLEIMSTEYGFTVT